MGLSVCTAAWWCPVILVPAGTRCGRQSPTVSITNGIPPIHPTKQYTAVHACRASTGLGSYPRFRFKKRSLAAWIIAARFSAASAAASPFAPPGACDMLDAETDADAEE